MKKRKFFSGALKFLVLTLLAVALFTKGTLQTKFAIAVFIIAGVWFCQPAFIWLGRKIKPLFMKVPFVKEPPKKFRIVRTGKAVSGIRTDDFRVPDISDSASVVLLRHVNHRISAYLKSAYPDVTWEWIAEQPERLVSKGGTGRIRLFNVPDFNFADVEFDQMAHINCDFLKLVPLADIKTATGVPADEVKADQPIDPATWYSLQGKSVLESCVGDLNSHGFKTLNINESGEIVVKQNDKEIAYSTLNHFPAKQYWPGLAAVLGKAGWSASVIDSGLVLSW